MGESDTLPFASQPDRGGDAGGFSVDPVLEVVYDWDLATDVVAWGPGLCHVVGTKDCEDLATGLGYAEHLVTGSPSSRYEAIMATGGCDTGGGVPFRAVYGLAMDRRSSAPVVWIEDNGRWFADAADRPGRAHGIIRVITRRYEADLRLATSAQLDERTGTFTRTYFFEQLARHLSLTQRTPASFAVLLLNIDVAEGMDEKDGCLIPALQALKLQMRVHELLAHYAGSRFAVLLENCNAEQAFAAADRFIRTIAEAPGANGTLLARVGAVIAPCHARTPHALLQLAEEALDSARQPASPPIVRYEPGRSRRSGRPMQASDEILSALNEDRVVLALQPVVGARTRAIAFHEALVRVERLNGTLIMPDALVPSAEKSGLVPLIDRRVIELAFARLTADRKLVLSINAAVASLYDSSWLDRLRTSCKLRPDAARRLTVEITETGVISDIDAARSALTAIKLFGVKVAIDDFGSGHSSFRNLRDLPIDYLKIDGAFAQNLANSVDDRFFIRTLIDLARNLRIPTVAEWVEDEETARLLGDWGVDYLQGHLFGRAVIASNVVVPEKSRP